MVDVYSLDSKEQKRVAKALRQALGEDVEVSCPPPLLRSELKGIKLREDGRDGGRLILLCHYNEGRVLLTDEDGMYNDFILEACRVTGGNVFVALAPVSTSAASLANETLVTALAYSGGQQGLLSIHMQKRFLTWNKAPSEAQVECLRAALDGAMEPLSVPESVLEHSEGRQGGRISLCNIL
ncbi:unnamed protein product [Ectocarpus fasciculatus]